MSDFQDLEPYFSAYQAEIKKARIQKGLTIAELSESSGVPVSTVAKICAGNQSSPNLYNSAALCRTLGLSLDKLFGLPSASEETAEMQAKVSKLEERARELQLRNVALTGEVENAKSEISHQKEKADMLQAQLSTRRPVIYGLMCVSAAMAFTLLIYIILDINVPDVGFIQHGQFSAAAWFVISLIAVSAGIITWSIIRAVRKPKKGPKK